LANVLSNDSDVCLKRGGAATAVGATAVAAPATKEGAADTLGVTLAKTGEMMSTGTVETTGTATTTVLPLGATLAETDTLAAMEFDAATDGEAETVEVAVLDAVSEPVLLGHAVMVVVVVLDAVLDPVPDGAADPVTEAVTDAVAETEANGELVGTFTVAVVAAEDGAGEATAAPASNAL
jgi:hypothetical protein